jgi:hypothetical protein
MVLPDLDRCREKVDIPRRIAHDDPATFTGSVPVRVT